MKNIKATVSQNIRPRAKPDYGITRDNRTWANVIHVVRERSILLVTYGLWCGAGFAAGACA
ncbi:MAG: hypothetical protein LBK06_03595 [Planctomycetaceae bacterium]|jgi:hypothetical protein|nr:hypothetical protein [Planctomycetaceae bacterium]